MSVSKSHYSNLLDIVYNDIGLKISIPKKRKKKIQTPEHKKTPKWYARRLKNNIASKNNRLLNKALKEKAKKKYHALKKKNKKLSNTVKMLEEKLKTLLFLKSNRSNKLIKQEINLPYTPEIDIEDTNNYLSLSEDIEFPTIYYNYDLSLIL